MKKERDKEGKLSSRKAPSRSIKSKGHQTADAMEAKGESKGRPKREPQERKAITLHDLADQIGVSYFTALRWLNAKKFEAVRMGRHYRVSVEERDRILREGIS